MPQKGTKPGTSHRPKPTKLPMAGWWVRSLEMKVDVGWKLQFPDVVHTSLRLHIVLWIPEDKKIIQVELPVP